MSKQKDYKDQKNKSLRVRMTAQDLEDLKRLAAAAGVSVSEFVRNSFLKGKRT